MCQLKAVVERESSCETVMESITGLEVMADGVMLSTYFEEPLTLKGVKVKRIDLLGGLVLLAEDASNNSSTEKQ